jgi:signal transduction histidine kinase/ligand-binding sensor domain-containing protein/CheY-like chemotaxis protein
MKKLSLLRFLHRCMLLRYLAILLFEVIILTALSAQHNKVWMKHHDGLFVTMMQDSKGYIWVGGFKNGLWRYDGQHFKLYKGQSNQPDSLRGRIIVFLTEASDGTLWIGSDYGLHHFDPETERFKNYPLDSALLDPNNPLSSYIAYFHQDKWGNFWTDNIVGVHRWDPQSMQSTLFTPKELDGRPVQTNSVGNTRLTPAFVEDQDGLLWFGLRNAGGLFRYDPRSKKGRLFRHQPEKDNSLPDNQVHSMHIDPEGNLWIGTANGLCRYQTEEESFVRYPSPVAKEPDGKEQPVLQINTDRSGRLWIVRSYLIQRFKRDRDLFKTYYQITDWRPRGRRNDPFRKDHSFCFIGEGRGGVVWFSHTGENMRVFGYQHERDVIEPFWITGEAVAESAASSILTSMVDRNGLLWLGYNNGRGLFQLDVTRERFAAFHDENDRHPGIGSNRKKTQYLHSGTTSFFEDNQEKIWLNTSILSQYFPEKRQWAPSLTPLRNPPHFFDTNLENPVPILEDKKGNLWLTASNSLIRMSAREKSRSFANLALAKPVRASSVTPLLTNRKSPEFAVDERLETAWVSTRASANEWIEIDFETLLEIKRVEIYWGTIMTSGNFTYRLQISEDGRNWQTFHTESVPGNAPIRTINKPAKGRFLRITGHETNEAREMRLLDVKVYGPSPTLKKYQWPSDFTVLEQNRVGDIHEDQAGRIWIAASEGLGLYNEAEDRFEFYYPFPDRQEPGSNELYMVLEGRDDRLWLKSRFTNNLLPGILVFDKIAKSFIHYQPQDTITPDLNVTDMLLDHEGYLWISGRFGVQKFDPDSKTFTTIIEGDGEDAFNYLFQDSRGMIWVAKMFDGIFRLDPKTNAYRHFRNEEGWVSNLVSHPTEDDRGFIWLSGKEGLLRYDPQNDSFWHFDRGDGLHSNERGAFYKDSRGHLYFGNAEGFTVFNPNEIDPDPQPPELVFTDFKLLGESAPVGEEQGFLSQHISQTNNIVLPYDKNIFTFEFIGIHFAKPENIRYSAKMEGINDDWVNLGNRNSIDYQGLAPGRYTFRLRAANPDGVWSEPKSIAITIRPPWWQTWWAYTLYALVAFGVIFAIYRIQLDRQLEQAETRRLAELDAVKTKLYTNITHEFRTPLTIILGMIDQMEHNPKDWFREGLRMIRRNGRNLLTLVNQMLDLRKLESGTLPVNMIQGDVVNYLQYITESFHSYAESKDIRLHFLCPHEELYMDYDPEKLLTIVSNLLSNAVKFTSEGGNVYVSVKDATSAERTHSALRTLSIQVKDTGAGISQEKLPHIFDRFYQADDSATRPDEGTGIGLALTKELVKLLGGSIEVESTEGKGTTFTVMLPVTREAAPPSPPEGGGFHAGSHSNMKFSNLPEQPSAWHSPPSGGQGGALALLVEDNEDVIRYIQSCLAADYRLAIARNGQEGIEKALELVPDVIISDVMMPEKDGFELCDTLKKDMRTSHIPIILLTAKADQESKIKGLSEGADAYLAKPFNKEELFVRLRKLIELRRELQERYASGASAERTSSALRTSYPREDAFLQRLRQTLEAHLSEEDFGIPQLCRTLGMSRTQLHRKLKALTGRSTSIYLRSLRLAKARELLKSSDLNVSEVAYEVGFSSPGYFTQVFSEEFGMPPSALKGGGN